MHDDRDNTIEKQRERAIKRMYRASKSSDEWSHCNFQEALKDYESTFCREMGS